MVKENLKYSEDPDVMNTTTSSASGQPGSEMADVDAAAPNDPVKPLKKANKSRKAVQEFLGGDYLSRELVTGNLVFILYLGLLAMIYIGNTYYNEKKINRIERTKSELKELRYQYITTKSILMFQGRQSEIAKRAMVHGLKQTTMPPYKILYSGEALKPKSK
jgi:hypothetical protein